MGIQDRISEAADPNLPTADRIEAKVAILGDIVTVYRAIWITLPEKTKDRFKFAMDSKSLDIIEYEEALVEIAKKMR